MKTRRMKSHNNNPNTELSPAERQKILVEWNNTQANYPKNKCIHQLVEEQVEQTPHAFAVVFEDQTVTYEQLNRRANQLAHHLQSLGIGPEVLVGICVERSVDMVVGLLAILKAGGAYVPLDPNYPKERLTFMLADSQVPVLLTQESLVKDLPASQAQTICLETLLDHNLLAENPVSDVTSENLAYVIYTSGSTGKPKGVMMRHRSLSNLITWQQRTLASGEAKTLQFAPISFDVSFQEIFSTWCSGGTLVLISELVRKDSMMLLRFLTEQAIERLFLPVVALQQLSEVVATGLGTVPATLREVITAGEPLQITPAIINWFEKQPHATLHNHYGPSETHVVTAFTLTGSVHDWPTLPPIGRPIANTQIYLLDQERQPVPIGRSGELYIGGVSLARGYLNHPELTQEKFIIHQQSRLYKTGDLARYRADGNIEFLGRIDHQVKIRGFRIELGEIETLLSQHQAVQQAVVIVWEVHQTDKRLVAYIIPNRKVVPTPTELRQFLTKQLPDYMVPAAFIILEKLPLTSNGKINRQALPTPKLLERIIDGKPVAPRTPLEELLTTIWTEVLELEFIGIADNFFELGGHSLLIFQVISRVQQRLQVQLSPSILFEYPTIAELAQHLESRRGNQPQQQPISVRQPNLPLSFFQEQLWFLAQLNPNVPSYNESVTIHINHKVNVAALEQSLNEIIKRHEALRTHFVSVSGQPVQMIMPPPTLKLPVVDMRSLPLELRPVKAQQLATQDAQRSFDLSQYILLRAILVQLETAQYRLFLTLHHLIIDGGSLAIFLKELAILYEALSTGQLSPLPKLPIQYADFANWQRQSLSAEGVDSQVSYWKAIFGDNLPLLQLPTDHPRPVTSIFPGAKQYLVLSKNLTEALKTLSQQAGVTLFMTLLAAFKTLVYRYTGQDDIVVGTVAAVRNRPELEHLIGYFLNTLLLRTDLSGTPTFQQLLGRVREVTLGAMAHKDLPFITVVEILNIERHFGQNALFQVAFTLDPSMPEIDLGWSLTQSDIDNGTAKFDLYLGLEEKPEGLTGRIEYRTDLFEADTIERMIGHFQTLLEGIVTNPFERISELPLLTEKERHQLLVEWNDTQTDYPKDKCIHHLFEEQVEQIPDHVAVVFEDQKITYRELNAKANQLAHYLQTLGVKPEVLVGICVERSIEMVIGLLGILKAGGAYVPLDPTYPAARLAFMLEDAQVLVLLTKQKLVDKLPLSKSKAQILCLDSDWETISQYNDKNHISEIKPENLAYVIYTSGSTGKPKGVMVEHHNVLAMLYGFEHFAPSDKLLIGTSVCPFSFDVSVWEFFSNLGFGGTLHILRPENFTNPENFSNYLIKHDITCTYIPPALLSDLVTQLEKLGNRIALNRILVGVEPIEQGILQRFRQLSENMYIINGYGPTETTICATFFSFKNAIDFKQRTPIGTAVLGYQVYLTDFNLQPVPIGVPGELHIGGAGLARGYLNRPELTAEKFIKNPFSDEPGSRLYKTGDLARYLPDGNIEFLGRIDNQVKIRGFRIELGEIETVLAQHASVREVAVITHEDQAGNQRLVAYVVLNPAPTQAAGTLRNYLKEKLPDYMIPSTFITLKAMPLTPNGKIDRQTLSQLSVNHEIFEKTFVAPRDTLEWQLTQIWEEVLDVYPIGVQDNFFELGGHSLLAVRLMAQIQQQFGQNLSIATLFQGATIELLAKLVRQQTDSQAWSPLVVIQPHGSKFPFFCMPGSGGNVIYFHQLARHLGQERPFYALQARGLDGQSAPFTCVEDIATYYLEAIRTLQPQGPYLLGGHSFGALVAFEMAQQLERQGQTVVFLAILDLPALHPDREPTELDWEEGKWMATIAHILESLSGKTLELCEQDFLALDTNTQLELLSTRLESVNLLPPDTGINYVRSLVQVIKADELAFLRYVPPTGYPNQITLFKTSDVYQDELGMLDEIPTDPAWGWERLSTKPVEVHEIPGSHTSMLTEPHVQVLADKLKKCLDEI